MSNQRKQWSVFRDYLTLGEILEPDKMMKSSTAHASCENLASNLCFLSFCSLIPNMDENNSNTSWDNL